MIRCPHCGCEVSEENFEKLQTKECPQCGILLTPEFSPWEPKTARLGENGLDFVSDFFTQIRRILVIPAQFFRNLPVTGGLSKPLAFALICHWIGSALAFLTSQVTGDKTWEKLLNLYLRDSGQFSNSSYPASSGWFLGMVSVLLDPFVCLTSLLATSLVFMIGARVLVSPPRAGATQEISYESAVRVLSYAMTPILFVWIPFVGKFIAPLYTVVITIVAVREVYRVSNSRAIVIALFPNLILLVMMLMGLIFFAGSFLKMLTPF